LFERLKFRKSSFRLFKAKAKFQKIANIILLNY
jgi:hypothetical protein